MINEIDTKEILLNVSKYFPMPDIVILRKDPSSKQQHKPFRPIYNTHLKDIIILQEDIFGLYIIPIGERDTVLYINIQFALVTSFPIARVLIEQKITLGNR